MSWRTATKTSGIEATVDYTPERKIEAVPAAEALATVDGEIVKRKTQRVPAIELAFYEAADRLLRAVQAAYPSAKVEFVTSGHVDSISGYGSVAIQIHAAK